MIGRLQGWLDGDVAARDPSVETADEVIRQIVQRRVHTAPDGTAFDAAGLLAEALEQLIELRLVQWTQRARFFTVAVRLVRTLVVQRHRAAVALPRGERVTLAERDAGTPPLAVDLDRLDAALGWPIRIGPWRSWSNSSTSAACRSTTRPMRSTWAPTAHGPGRWRGPGS